MNWHDARVRDSSVSRKFGLAMIVGFILLGMGAGSASAAEPITASANCCTFSVPSFTQAAGETGTFVNPADADAFHNVTSKDLGPDKKPLFASSSEPAGGSSPIPGTQYLTPGTYGFYCTIHTTAMSGQLVVDASGTAVPRPSVKLSVLKQKLNAVRNQGKLKVKLTGTTASSGVHISASAGNKKLGSVSGVSVAAGASKTVVVKLTSAGKKALKNKKKVSVSVKGSVPFGKPASASRKIQ